jgi:signal transduction histidine kinase
MNRLPIRLRLTLPYALGIAIVLAAIGLLVYVRVGDALLRDVDQNLRAQAAESAARIAHGESALDQEPSPTPAVEQVIGPNGQVVASAPRGLPAVRGSSGASAGARLTTGAIPSARGEWRILTLPVQLRQGHGTLVLATSLEQRDRTMRRLVREFVLGGAVALLLAIAAGYALAAAALRPVEAMRRRAAAITGRTAGRRLPVPRARDELARLADTLNDMLARLEGALEHERRFVDDASHELRTPLTLLRTEVELALRQPRSREDLEQALHSVAEETDRLSRLAEDLLLIARSDNGELPIRRELVLAEDLLERVARRFSSRAAEHGAELTLHVEPGTVLDVDPTRVEQALGNLVENALVHGGGRVLLTARARGSEVELAVTDEGAGFPPGFAEHAFDRFSRADPSRGPGGSGLGLAIVELIARAHGGRASVLARNGHGAAISLRLPAASQALAHESDS